MCSDIYRRLFVLADEGSQDEQAQTRGTAEGGTVQFKREAADVNKLSTKVLLSDHPTILVQQSASGARCGARS